MTTLNEMQNQLNAMQNKHIKTLEERIEVLTETIKLIKNNNKMTTQTTKEQLTTLILSLGLQQYGAFKDNYNIKGSRELLQFIEDLRDEEEEQEIINEILINISIK